MHALVWKLSSPDETAVSPTPDASSVGAMDGPQQWTGEEGAAPREPIPDREPVPAIPKRSRTAARVTWLVLHAVGLGLLALSGGWPAWRSHACDAFVLLLALLLALYAASSFVDPGYVPCGDEAGGEPPPALQESLLAVPHCTHCRARQVERTKVRAPVPRALPAPSL